MKITKKSLLSVVVIGMSLNFSGLAANCPFRDKKPEDSPPKDNPQTTELRSAAKNLNAGCPCNDKPKDNVPRKEKPEKDSR